MKVLQVITKSEEGGAQNVCFQTIAGLQKRGVEFEAAFFPNGWLHKECDRIGVKVHPLSSFRKEIRPIEDFKTFLAIWKILRKNKFDLIHCHSSKAGLLGRMAAFFARTPAIFTAHGWAFTEGAKKSNRMIGLVSEWFASRMTRGIICVSQHDQELGLKYKMGSTKKLRVIQNGAVDIDPSLMADPGTGTPVRMVLVARFSSQKDQKQLVRAAARLRGDFVIDLIGDGPLMEEAIDLTKELKVTDKVNFLGTRNDVPELLAKSHIGVLTSFYEGLPISLIEKLRAGLPLVASNVGGVDELINEGENGNLIERNDVDTLVKRLQALVDSAELRSSMGNASRKLFLDNFYIDAFLDKTYDLYESVLRR